MNGMKKGKGAAAACAAIAALLVLSTCLGIVLRNVGSAYASTSVYLEMGGSIYYGGYSTTWAHADGAMAYCGNPSASTPASGFYEKLPISSIGGRDTETRADLWFGYGGPGFDASMWPSAWYDGGEMTDARYATLTHILLSDTFSSDGDYALYGCSQDFKDWVRWNVIGFGVDGTEINPGATGRQICARMGEMPSGFDAFMLQTGSGSQLVLSFTPAGALDLTKVSANEAVTANNACYSTEGATYGTYSDAGCTQEAARMTTDEAGHAGADGLALGTYWIREIGPSAGMALDGDTYQVRVEASTTVHVNGGTVTEVPCTNPVGMLVGKVDAQTGESRPEGAASLQGAEFTVEFYAGLYDTAEGACASGTLQRTWAFQTDEDGHAYYSDEYKTSGPDLYYQMDNTTAALPLGTVLITETAAPEGYNLDNGNHGAPETFVEKITDDGAIGEDVYTYNSPSVPDTVKRGDYRLMKEVPTTGDEEGQELTRIAVKGVEVQIVNDSDEVVVSPDTLEEVEPGGGVVTTLVTDEDGLATTKDHVPDGWTAALAYGDYHVHEVIPDDVAARVKAEHGITLIGVDDWQITTSFETQYDPVQIVANHIPQTPITIQKIDSTTAKAIPLRCSFQLYDTDGKLVTYTDHTADEVIDTWTALKSGKVMLPMKLDEGTYTLVEVAAPEGYVLGADAVTFTVNEYHTWDDPIVVTYEDAPIRGRIEIDKTSSTGGVKVGGAEYRVKAAADIVTGDGTVRAKAGDVIADVVTDSEGYAEVEGLFLGTCTVYETKSAPGYALDTSEHTVTIESQGQTVPIVTCEEDVTDTPTTIRILKVDSTDATKVLVGATFRIWQDVEDGYDETLTTGEGGTIDATLLPHGLFHIREIEAPEGYCLPADTEIIDFKVDDQGFIGLAAEGSQFSDALALTFENAPTIVDITKADLTTGTELLGAKLTVTDSKGTVIDTWTSTKEAHLITGIAPGTYTLAEVTAPEGYFISADVAFTVADTGEIQKVVMEDDYTKTDFSKTDIVTGEEISGAHLQVIDSGDKTVAEWDTNGTAHRINGLEPGAYTLRETTVPDGYEIAEDVSFTVEANGDVQKKTPRPSVHPKRLAPGFPRRATAFPGGSLPCWPVSLHVELAPWHWPNAMVPMTKARIPGKSRETTETYERRLIRMGEPPFST